MIFPTFECDINGELIRPRYRQVEIDPDGPFGLKEWRRLGLAPSEALEKEWAEILEKRPELRPRMRA